MSRRINPVESRGYLFIGGIADTQVIQLREPIGEVAVPLPETLSLQITEPADYKIREPRPVEWYRLREWHADDGSTFIFYGLKSLSYAALIDRVLNRYVALGPPTVPVITQGVVRVHGVGVRIEDIEQLVTRDQALAKKVTK